MNKSALKVYDFTLTAGGSQVILVESAYFRIMTAAGAVDVIGDTFGTLPGVQAGQGLQNTPYKRLTLRDASGAPNSGTILCSGDLFIDNRTIGNVELTGQQGAMTQAAANVTNASAQLLAAKPLRRFLLVQNNHATASVFLNLAGAAATVAAGVKLEPGGSLLLDNFVPSAAIFAIGDTASNTAVIAVEG